MRHRRRHPVFSNSNSSSTNTTVSGQGQITKGNTQQGGSKGIAGNKSKYLETGSTDLGGASIGNLSANKGGTLAVTNNGLSGSDLLSLVGNLTQATPSQIAAFSPATLLSPGSEAPPADQSQFAQPDTGSNPNLIYWIGGGALALILLIFLIRR